MERLAGAHELLDGPLDDEEALRGNLRDLRRYNALVGGAALSRKAVFALLDAPGLGAGPPGAPVRGREGPGAAVRAAGWEPLDDDVSVIDVGTGAADIPLALLRASARAARRLTVTAVDSRPEVIEAARSLEPSLDRTPGLRLYVADGRQLGFPDRSFDVAHSSLTLHHLDPADAIEFLSELRRVSRRGVVVNDVARARRWEAFAVIGTLLMTTNRLTRNDAPLSVRRAYTRDEMLRLLRLAGLRPVRSWWGLAGHRYAIAAVRA